MPYDPPPELAGLSLGDIAKLVEQRKLPPVEQWSPQETGDSHMRIAADGKWYHEGGVISRPAMVRAFSTLLLRDEGGQHWLVTPQQKLSIEVEDAAFQAVDVKLKGDALAFKLNTDDLVIAGSDHPLVARGDADLPAIYLTVRNGAEARINRSTWLQLADIALNDGRETVSSQGVEFRLVPK